MRFFISKQECEHTAYLISMSQWKKVMNAVPKDDMNTVQLFNEADKWLQPVFLEYGCFTMLGC